MTFRNHAARLAQRRLNLAQFQPVEFTCPLGWAASGAWTPAAIANAWNATNISHNSMNGSLKAIRPLQCKRSADRFFMYAEAGQPDRLADDLRKVSATELVSLPIWDFFKECSAQRVSSISSCSTVSKSQQSAHQPPYHYYTARVADILEAPPPGWETHVLDTFPDRRGTNMPPTQLGYCSVWLGGVGSATQAHYDVMHNVFVQAHGFKRFRLWPPSAHVAMAVFPDAHPRARKSRLDFEAIDKVEITSADGVANPSLEVLQEDDRLEVSTTALPPLLPPSLDIVLGPGQALYIPPFWFHHVEVVPQPKEGGENGIHIEPSTSSSSTAVVNSVSDPCVDDGVSVSLNVFSQARLTAAVSAVLARPPPPLMQGLPLHSRGSHDNNSSTSGGEGRVSSGGLAFARLARRLGSELGLGSHFARTVLLSRYREPGAVHDFPADPSPFSSWEGAVDGDADGSATDAAGVQAEAWALETANALRHAVHSAEAVDGGASSSDQSSLPESFNNEQQRDYFEGVVSICAAHILEATALRAFGAVNVEKALTAAEIL